MSLSASDLQILMGELEHLRAGVESYGTTNGDYWYAKGEDFTADQARYDRALLAVARHLGIPTPPDPPQIATVILSRPDRAKLEELIRAVGTASSQATAAGLPAQDTPESDQ